MSYGEADRAQTSGFLRKTAWALIVVGVACLAFLSWHESLMLAQSRKYGIEAPWLRPVLWLIAFTVLEAAAIYAAVRGYHGVSIAFGGFVAALLGLISLVVLAGAGM